MEENLLIGFYLIVSLAYYNITQFIPKELQVTWEIAKVDETNWLNIWLAKD